MLVLKKESVLQSLLEAKPEGRMITSSNDEEKSALTISLEYLANYYPYEFKVLICTDSQSLRTAIEIQQTQPRF